MNRALRPWPIIATLIFVIGLVHLAYFRQGHIWGDDFAEYLMHARNLAFGHPYAEIGYIYNPHYTSLGPPTYPPGCPIMLAPLYRLFGLNLTVFKLEMLGIFFVTLLVVYWCFHDELGTVKSAALVLILGLNHYFLKDAALIASDIPFLALVYLEFLLVKKADANDRGTRERMLYFGLVGLVAYLAFSTRTLGALLIPAILIPELVTTRRISRPTILAIVVFVGLALVQSVFLHSDRHYLNEPFPGLMVLAHNALGYLVRWAVFWHNGYLAALSLALFGLMTLLAILGYVESIGRRITVCETFVPIYLAVILLWPCYQGERFLYPLFPLYVFYTLRGLEHRWIASRAALRPVMVTTLAAAVSLTYAAQMFRLDRGPYTEGVTKPESVQLFTHIRNRTSENDVIVFIKPRALSLFTGRQASVCHRVDNDQDLWDYFRQIRATRLVVVENDAAFQYTESPEMVAFAREFAERNRERLEPTYSNHDFTVYRIQ